VSIHPSDVLLTGSVAVVTGGGAGIGRGVAAGLAAFGASVAIWERNPVTCESAAGAIGALGIETDVRDSEQVDAALQRTVENLGPSPSW
jgi:3-oxoacyl-[acyl-carrier protein] reductase